MAQKTTVKTLGSGYAQGCTTLANGNIYVMRWSSIIEIDTKLNSSIYSGDPTVTSESKLGHRLEARYFNLHTVYGLSDRLLLYDYGACIVLQIFEDQVLRIAGSGERGVTDGPADKATFDYIWGITATTSGHILAVDRDNNCIRIISPEGQVSTIGSMQHEDIDGGVGACSFAAPFGICVTPDQSIYVSCMTNHLRRISPDLQHVTTVLSSAGGRIEGLCASSDGSVLLCNYSDGKILKFDPFRQELAKVHLDSGSPRGVTIPKNSAIFVSENVDSSTASYFTNLPPEFANVGPFFPKILNRKLFGGGDLDFVGFEVLLHPDAPSIFAPSDLLFMPSGFSPINYHSHILDRFRLKVPLAEAFNGLFDTVPQPTLSKLANLPSLLLYHIYSCGEQLDISNIPEKELPAIYSFLILLLRRLGLVSAFLLQSLHAILGKQTTHDLVTLLNMLTLLPDIDTSTVESICQRLAHPTSFFEQYAPLLEPLKLAHPALHEILTSRIKTGLPALPACLRSVGWTSTVLPSTDKLLPDVHQAFDAALSLLSDRLQWESFNPEQSGQETLAHHLEEQHLWLVGIQGYPKAIRVPDWVLYSRWPYFRRMIQSGLVEYATRALLLPSDFPVSFMLPLLRYLHDSYLDTKLIHKDDKEILKTNAGEYELQDLQGEPQPGFHALFQALNKSES